MAMMDVLKRISDTIWEIPMSYKEGMRVPARIYGTQKLIREMDDGVYDQVTNVATLSGITKYALCMPDGHFGYGFPMGGVAAMKCGINMSFVNRQVILHRIREVFSEIFGRSSELARSYHVSK